MTSIQKSFVLFIAILFISCGATHNSVDKGSAKKNSIIETGIASWYGPEFQGKKTATGEIYDMEELTAAHRTMPFNSIVLVENLDNGKKVQVRINDRGPFAKERIIDVSRKAAEILGMIGPGTANVRLHLIEGDLENSKVTDLKIANYTLQMGSYKDKNRAKNISAQIDGSRIEEVIVKGDRLYRIYYGNYQDENEAQKDLKTLRRKGHEGFVKQIEND